MHITNSLLHFCVLASTVSAFYPYVPDYNCAQGGNCADTSKRGLSSELVEAIGKKGSFEVKLKRTKALALGQPPSGKAPRLVERLGSPFEKRESSYKIIPSKDPGLPNSAPIDNEGQDFSYMAVVKFGSAGKELNLLMDTGSSKSWVMGETCISKACTHHNLLDESDSTTYVETLKKFSADYGSGSVSGMWVKDNVEVAGFNVSLEFGVADKVFDGFENFAMDGIIGLAVPTGTEQPGFLASLIKDGHLKKPIFGVNLHRSSDRTNDGSIVFGGIDSSKVVGAITYSPLRPEHPGIWMITSGDAGIGGKNGGLAGQKVFIDSGTSFCFLPPDDAAKFYSTFPDARVGKTGGSYTVPCNTTAPAHFTFGDVTYEIPAKDWVAKTPLPADGGRCTSNIYSRDASGSDETKFGAWLMGATFLKNVYQVYDVGQQRIGFAKKPDPPPPTSTSSASSKSTEPSSATATSTEPTVDPFNGFIAGAGATATAASLNNNDPASGAAPHLSTSLALIAAIFMASLILLI